MKLSVIDYGVIDEGSNPRQALVETVQLAQAAEQLGYHRFWVAEHHDVPAFAISSPELMLAHLAAKTHRIRLGSGGIMALHYTTFKLAETVATLSHLVPDRLDIGWGNSLGTARVTKALNSQHGAEAFEQVLSAITSQLLTDQLPVANPKIDRLPQAFTLGMGGQSAQIAARLGMGYVLGLFPYIFQSPEDVITTTISRYRSEFVPTVYQSTPYAMLAVFVVVAASEAEAERLATATAIWLLGKREFSEFSQFPSPETADRYAISKIDAEKIAQQRDRLVVGTPTTVMERLRCLASANQIDELLIIPLVSGINNRLRTLELLQDLLIENDND